jgi:hypothetical protein
MPKPTRLVTLTLAAVLAIGLAACGGSPSGRPQAPVAAAADPLTSRPSSPSAPVSGSASAGTSVACGLVTTTEVATAVGYQIAKSEGADSTLAGTDICVFQGTQEGTGLYVTLYNTPKAQELSLSIEPASEQVAGLGDGAFWASSAGLFVKKGSRLLGLHDLTLNAGRDALAALAAQAVARM